MTTLTLPVLMPGVIAVALSQSVAGSPSPARPLPPPAGPTTLAATPSATAPAEAPPVDVRGNAVAHPHVDVRGNAVAHPHVDVSGNGGARRHVDARGNAGAHRHVDVRGNAGAHRHAEAHLAARTGPADEAPYPASAGEVIFSELMPAPEAGPEYLELYNPTDHTLRIGGCAIGRTDTSSDPVTIDASSLTIPPNGYLLMSKGDFGIGCDVVPDYVYDGLTLVNDGATVFLSCPGTEGDVIIDQVTYEESTGPDGASFQVRPGLLESGDRSGETAWCYGPGDAPICGEGEASDYGTPGQVNRCARTPAEGEVMLEEILLDAPEYVDLEALATDPDGLLNLQGCMLQKGSCADWDDEACRGASSRLDEFVPLPEGEAVLLASGGTVTCLSHEIAGDDESPCLVPADANFSALSFKTSGPEYLFFVCPARDTGELRLVDSVGYDWRDWAAQCTSPDGLCSLNRRSSDTTSSSPALETWCIGTSDQSFVSDDGEVVYGAPGVRHACPAAPPDVAAGAVVIDELQIAPFAEDGEGVEGHELLELVNVGEEAVDLSWCRLYTGKLVDGGVDLTDADRFSLADWDPSTAPIIAPGEVQLWALEGCLVTQTTGTDEEEQVTCLEVSGTSTVHGYSGLSLHNTAPGFVSLRCEGSSGEVEIDTVTFDFTGERLEHGRSWQLRPERTDATANDDHAAWCQAPFDQLYYTTGKGGLYGTPGLENACGDAESTPCVDCDEELGTGCGCASAGGPPAGTRQTGPGHVAMGLLELCWLGLLARWGVRGFPRQRAEKR